MNLIILLNNQFREPIFTLSDAELGRLSTINELA